ncbi:MAG: HNH endonuclease [Firmicutes bacterium]|nr:HNH endonuclease [Bacillota bacterium]MBU4553732.1 HNH endonuclease [Bacillota bacterium]MBV1728465.1 HNH endonuclease [Desulforudis sp.]MBV1735754.1 HNH endonuclease [Desulforudis sp.]MBV1770100.1 HNH endonuclease [Desulforudis sp.]
MPNRLKSPCSVPGCPNLVEPGTGGRCEKHKRPAWDGRTWQDNPWSTPEMQRLRRQVLREEPNCRDCGKPSSAVDHIHPRAWGGSHDRANLQGLCTDCSRAKTQREAAVGRRRT